MARTLEDISRMVGDLLRTADRMEKTHPGMSANYRAKAEQLMRDYRLEEETLIAQDQFSIMPVKREAAVIPLGSEWHRHHINLWWAVERHTGIRTHFQYESSRGYVAYAVGYDVDVRYAIFLFNAAHLMFASKLEPQYDPSESEADNIYRLRSAGITRQRVAQMVWGRQGQKEGEQVSKIYQQACAARGEDAAVVGRNVNAKTYRAAYADAFVERFRSRLWQARNAANSDGGTLVIHGRAERVEEAFFTHFPQYRPQPQPEVEEEEKPAGKPKKGRQLKSWTAADEVRYQRMHNSPAAVRARAAGQAAADGVEVSRVAPTKRVEEGRGEPEGQTGRKSIESE